MILKMIRHEYGPALTADNKIILYLHTGGLWRWIGSDHKEIEYNDHGDLKILGFDLV